MRGKKNEPKPERKLKPRLSTETRSYVVSEGELSEWLTGGSDFYLKTINVQGNGDIEFIVTTEKLAERPSVERPLHTVNQSRAEHGLPPLDADGPAVLDEDTSTASGKADARPFIADADDTPRARLKTRRMLDAERIAAGKEPLGMHPTITHRTDTDDDPVPSALPS